MLDRLVDFETTMSATEASPVGKDLKTIERQLSENEVCEDYVQNNVYTVKPENCAVVLIVRFVQLKKIFVRKILIKCACAVSLPYGCSVRHFRIIFFAA